MKDQCGGYCTGFIKCAFSFAELSTCRTKLPQNWQMTVLICKYIEVIHHTGTESSVSQSEVVKLKTFFGLHFVRYLETAFPGRCKSWRNIRDSARTMHRYLATSKRTQLLISYYIQALASSAPTNSPYLPREISRLGSSVRQTLNNSENQTDEFDGCVTACFGPFLSSRKVTLVIVLREGVAAI